METVSGEAYEAAESLLEGYRQQDLRMDSLIEGDYEGAREAEEEALYEMADAFEFEFPESEYSREAGRQFMVASFMQDEIENWNVLRSDPVALDHTTIPTNYGSNEVITDERWDNVRERLGTVCDLAGIDDTYADAKTEFLRHHGSGSEEHRKYARKAETAKIKAMIADENQGQARSLTEYFLKGLQKHDEWDQHDGVDESTLEVVTDYYRMIEDLR